MLPMSPEGISSDLRWLREGWRVSDVAEKSCLFLVGFPGDPSLSVDLDLPDVASRTLFRSAGRMSPLGCLLLLGHGLGKMGPCHLPLLGDSLPLFCSLSPEETISLSSYNVLSLPPALFPGFIFVPSGGGARRNSSTPSCPDRKSVFFGLKKKLGLNK